MHAAFGTVLGTKVVFKNTNHYYNIAMKGKIPGRGKISQKASVAQMLFHNSTELFRFQQFDY